MPITDEDNDKFNYSDADYKRLHIALCHTEAARLDLEIENTRMRAALQEISELEDVRCDEACTIAKQALDK